MRILGGLPQMNKVTKLAFVLSPTLQVRYHVFAFTRLLILLEMYLTSC